jgi:hypothetical protein
MRLLHPFRFQVVRVVLFVLAVLPSIGYGEQVSRHELEKHGAGVESLSPGLRDLLTKEMLGLQNGMMSIIPAYVSGNWSVIETIADKMQGSYILNKNITDQQVKELHAALPDSFIKLDQQFHYLSGMLSHAAKNKKAELVGFYFSKLSEACVNCHAEYATHKFPAFALQKKMNTHSH